MYTRPKKTPHNLQLRLCLSLLEDRVELSSLHDIALDLELSAHEQSLRISLASDKAGEVFVGKSESDCI